MRLGVLGAGQLGRMLALAAAPLGIAVRCLDPTPAPPAAVAAECVTASYLDLAACAGFANGLDAITYEFENVPFEVVDGLSQRVPVRPGPVSLKVGQHRLREKALFGELQIDTAAFAPARGRAEIVSVASALGLPVRLKTCALGYDGKGQAFVADPATLDAVAAGWPDVETIVERHVAFEREVSMLVVRSIDGEIRHWPLIENTHVDGMLSISVMQPDDPLTGAARSLASRLVESLGHVGVLALELFVVNGALMANELAPRVHNSGHLTIEGTETSQFENHVRAVCGLPLGSTAPRGFTAMVNLVGTLPDTRALLAIEGAHLHLYGKSPRPGRKLGHVTLHADDRAALEARLRQACDITAPESRRRPT